MKAQKIKALKLAREYIKRGKRDYVCYALSLAYMTEEDAKLYKAVGEIKDKITNAIKPYLHVDDWLRAQGVKIQNGDELRQYRLDWIDFMIEQVKRGEL